MSIAKIITRGFGNGTIIGTIKDVVTRGYGIAVAVVPFTPVSTVSARAVSRELQSRATTRTVQARR